MESALFEGEQLYKLIPQRPPIVMVDTLQDATDTEGHTALIIKDGNIFCSENRLREPGLIEHIAQSAAAFAGYPIFKKGLAPKLGFIGEIKKCTIYKLPKVGSRLNTYLHVMGEAAGVTLISAQTSIDGELVAECQMKIFLKED